MKKAATLFVLLCSGLLPLAAQSNQLLDQILAQPELSFGQAAYLLLTAAQKLPEQSSPEQAAEALASSGWRVKARPAEEPMPLGEYSYLLMQAFGIRGGLMYRLFPGPRYATRELASRKWITGRAWPGRALSGEEAVRLLGAVMESRGGRS